ncbi:tetratricopeptide repeat protein [Parasulfitobacter algicola]|uniref:Tetratricopeptide repeat protein n=1 Tax=Parasulfitobacter algicola TaxID=2614809 RepID=A0ABX2ISX2_9RHOB|nr:tetratricopeptide repeat protein [Sulfitobacter algicola]NSX56009.1 tetratricopeptide repeat protein [Sulfitobacter algicola]
MRQQVLFSICLTAVIGLAACEKKGGEAEVERALKDLNVIDESNLNNVMATAADPNEAVSYFRRATTNDPDRIDLQRGLAQSLVRAKRPTEAVTAWAKVVDHKESVPNDRVELADALIRTGQWDRAESVLDSVPPTHETFKRYRLEAMVADSNQEWDKSDSFYETALGLTTRPSGVLNNWGYSKMSRGDHKGAESLFIQAIQDNPKLFTAKNNLILARGAQRRYDLPLIKMTQIERAQLLHTLALTAIKQGDVNVGKGLLQEAIDTHPQHFEAAVISLRALQNGVSN